MTKRPLTRADVPDVLVFGGASPTEEADGYRQVIEATGCSQRDLAEFVPRSQSHISKRVKNGGYCPPSLPRLTAATDPRHPVPAGRHRLVARWCAHQLDGLGWVVALEHYLPVPPPPGRPRRVDVALSRPGPWSIDYTIEVKGDISTARDLREAVDYSRECATQVGCVGLVVARSVKPGLIGAEEVVLAKDLRWVIGECPTTARH